jgi:hypothetical protein
MHMRIFQSKCIPDERIAQADHTKIFVNPQFTDSSGDTQETVAWLQVN